MRSAIVVVKAVACREPPQHCIAEGRSIRVRRQVVQEALDVRLSGRWRPRRSSENK